MDRESAWIFKDRAKVSNCFERLIFLWERSDILLLFFSNIAPHMWWFCVLCWDHENYIFWRLKSGCAAASALSNTFSCASERLNEWVYCRARTGLVIFCSAAVRLSFVLSRRQPEFDRFQFLIDVAGIYGFVFFLLIPLRPSNCVLFFFVFKWRLDYWHEKKWWGWGI